MNQTKLKIYNSQSKKLEEFVPRRANEVSMYVCGPTVYNFLHIGNFRGPVFFNFVRNWLEHLGYQVKFALNFTDVDDRILQAAKEQNKKSSDVSEQYIHEYKTDYAALGLRPHDYNPKVTEYMSEIIQMIQKLIENGKAYEVKGDVWYSVQSFAEYGKLSGRKTDELLAGVRIDVDQNKKSHLDFALWKAVEASETHWPSPWGPGRPGWHIECSAMIDSLFGEQIDIHGGGTDLIFPHHENEIAQSEGCSHKSFVNYWMHVGMLNIAGQKMSKSLGNFITQREFLQLHPAEVYKWMILSVHYRSLAEFSDEAVDRAYASLARIYSSLSLADSILKDSVMAEKDLAFEKELQEQWSRIEAALNDDFGTPQAVAVMFDVIRLFNSKAKRGIKVTPKLKSQAEQFKKFVQQLGSMMGLFQHEASQFLRDLDNQLLGKMGLERAKVDELVQLRSQARAAKDFAKSDEYRGQLTAMGIAVMDTPEGSFWEVAKG